MYKVSILVPIYGVERYIERCARSLFEQTYQNLEFVFVNDCSPDRSMEVLNGIMDDYLERKDDVRVVNQEKNKGLAAARNVGLDNATGDFVVIVDSDDWLELNAVELLVNKQIENDADLVSGNRIVHYHSEDGLLYERGYQSKEEMVLQVMQRSWDHFITGRLFRRSLFVDNSLRWNDGLDLAEDRFMMTLLAYQARSFDAVDNVVYHYERRNIGSITGKNDRKKTIRNNRQELGNVLSLEQFFMNKKPVYQKESTRCVMEQLEFNLQTALDYSDKDEYYDIAGIIDGRSDADLKLIDWKKKGMKGWVLHHYLCMKLIWVKDRTIRYMKKRLKKAVIKN